MKFPFELNKIYWLTKDKDKINDILNFINLSKFETFYVPIEHVSLRPEIVPTLQARLYLVPDLYVFNEKILTGLEIQKSAGDNFRGASNYPGIFLAEIWDDFGYDGHIKYEICGYRFVSLLCDDEKRKNKSKLTGCDTDLPTFMTILSEDWD